MSAKAQHESQVFSRGTVLRRFETRVFRVRVNWDGGDYHLSAMIQKNDWTNVDYLGELGWEFVAFVPDPEVYIEASFEGEDLASIKMAVFKRELAEGEDMWTDYKTKL